MAKKQEKRPDTPLAATPITDVQGVFADIEKRSKDRFEARAASQEKIAKNRKERKSSGGAVLYGLSSFAKPTGN
jgi:hypothetical protein